LTEHLLNHGEPEDLIDHLKNERPREFTEVARLMAEVKTASSISLAALQVVVRWISRLAETP
jgi:hypothetical protein